MQFSRKQTTIKKISCWGKKGTSRNAILHVLGKLLKGQCGLIWHFLKRCIEPGYFFFLVVHEISKLGTEHVSRQKSLFDFPCRLFFTSDFTTFTYSVYLIPFCACIKVPAQGEVHREPENTTKKEERWGIMRAC